DRDIQARSLTAGAIDDNADLEAYRKAMKKLSSDRASLGMDEKLWYLDAPTVRHSEVPTGLDVALVIDTTGSMGDELEYLKVEIRDIAQEISKQFPGVEQRWAMVVYRDRGDAYVTRSVDFEALDAFVDDLGKQRAGGGGDTPEAMDRAMIASSRLSWRNTEQTARMVFLVADAPSHAGKGARRYAQALLDHRRAKTAIYPIASSGVAGRAEAQMRLAAKITGGQYIFLTDHSGIGGHHEEAHVDSYKVESLHDAMARMIRDELGGDERAKLVQEPQSRPEVEPDGESEECATELSTEISPVHAAVEGSFPGDQGEAPSKSLWQEFMERLMAHLLFASTMAVLLMAAIGADSRLRHRRAARG
ncbi:MAG TPA: VWA domain-containing protein, partial [Nannocystis exedens]|nr:VWA domain-containing protein [Nannocystis exedens]